jgi:glyoxylase-like metal-dependent hydrolase (beta-lactamase superfamily II)
VTELAPGIHSLGHGKGGHVHAFLLDDGGELSLVDTLFESDARLVLEAIRALGRSPRDLKRIAITHGHRSHLGGLAALKRASGATVYATNGKPTSSRATDARRPSASCRASRSGCSRSRSGSGSAYRSTILPRRRPP